MASKRRLSGLSVDEHGAATAEYMLLLGMVTLALVAAVGAFGGLLASSFDGFTAWLPAFISISS